MGVEEFRMTGAASPDNPDEGQESPTSTSASPENGLEGVGTPGGSSDDMGGSAAVLDATSSATTSRCSSPLASGGQVGHFPSGSLQQWKRQMQRVWRWGPAGGAVSAGNREQSLMATLNLEIMAKQKRLWYRTQSKNRDIKQHWEPTSLFEQFFIVGLHSHANVEVLERAFSKRKAWESEAAKSDVLDLRKLQYNGQIPALEPQVLFKYPPVKRVAMRESDIPDFCFPEGVKARLVERTPSMSDLNELVFGQEHLARDDLSFIFCLKVSDNSTLYGVCLHVQEIVQRAPGILGAVSPVATSCKPTRFLVAAPRCYCLLTRVPFFELHYEMLNSIISQERLDRITQFISDLNPIDPVPRVIGEHVSVDENCDYLGRESFHSWTEFAIPIDSVAGLTSSSAEREAAPILFRPPDCHSPESACFSEISDTSHARELDKESRRSWQCLDDCTSENSGYRSDSFETVSGVFENGQTSPELNSTIYHASGFRLERVESLESIYSSFKGLGSEDEDDEFCSKLDTNAGDEKVIEWAKANGNEPLQIVCGYHALPIPTHGKEIIFHPLEHLQPINYCRPDLSSLGLDSKYGGEKLDYPEFNELNSRLAAAEEAFAFSIWTVATVCRALSLESVLALITGALLEKQVVVKCPNLGVLSAIVFSTIPMIRPFEWQSLFLPVLPRKMLDFLDAPVPFIVNTCSLPQLPRYRELVSELTPVYARLACEDSIAKRHPVYKCSEVQAEAAGSFLCILRRFMESLCLNLRANTITNIQANNDKVSLLLKDSFIDSFPMTDRPFMKHFVDTQLFSVLSDSRMSSFENEKPLQ
ncbi:uncharacterized protein LOC110022034 isoform X2 [Phalaenopsis equestris]|uniref:uncharacterized protein LOC110022034 isoform X2 n=1 Tax=Phalaenopsis equestris TaxID=78828 RepID=UPI0009E2E0A5|nr:uncharacterized protein LOC110022034 isoform X2 [Phalaenopsis equestris]